MKRLIIILILLCTLQLHAGAIHAVIGTVQFEDNSYPNKLTWTAFITARPEEVITFDSSDPTGSTSVYDPVTGNFLLQCSRFSVWDAGEFVQIDFLGDDYATASILVELSYNAWDDAGPVVLSTQPELHPVTGSLEVSDQSIPASITWNAYITARPQDVLSFDSANPPQGTAATYNPANGSFSLECTEFASWTPGETLHIEFTGPEGETGSTELLLTDAAVDDAGTVILEPLIESHKVNGTVIYQNSSIPARVTWSAYIKARPQEVLNFDSAQPTGKGTFNASTGAFSLDCSEFSTWAPAETLHIDITDHDNATAAVNVVLSEESSEDAGIVVLHSGPDDHQVIGTLVYKDGTVPQHIMWSMYITTRPQDVVSFNNEVPGSASEYDAGTGAFMVQCSELSAWSPNDTLHVDFQDGMDAMADIDVILGSGAADDVGTVILEEEIENHTVTGNVRYDDGSIPASISWSAYITANPVDMITFDSRNPQDTLAAFDPETGSFILVLEAFEAWAQDDTLQININDNDEKTAITTVVLSGTVQDSAGTVTLLDDTGIESGTASTPEQMELMQNYPNPFNPVTMISYRINSAQHVSLQIFNSLGQSVRTLADGLHQPGEFQVQWDGTNNAGQKLPSGNYVYVLSGENFYKTLKAVILK